MVNWKSGDSLVRPAEALKVSEVFEPTPTAVQEEIVAKVRGGR